MLDVATQAAPSSATVLILGESGTGKELIARYIHSKSCARIGPFVAVNCAAIPESILEAELFGHERGAFTGAIAQARRALRARARRHAISGRNWRAQPRGAGEDPARAAGGRVRARRRPHREGRRAHRGRDESRSWSSEVEAGRFREDLYYRLNVIAVTAPPLRARREDIPLLVDHSSGVYCTKNGRARLDVCRATCCAS